MTCRARALVAILAATALWVLPWCAPPTEGEAPAGAPAGGLEPAPPADDPTGEPSAEPETPGPGPGDTPAPAGCREVDLLFVIDDSGSMAEEQDNLARNFPEFIAQLEAYETSDGGRLDYRVGITSTSRDRLTFDTSVIAKQGGARCAETAECTGARQICECPALGFEACSEACPGDCFCEPPGFTMPASQSCTGADGALQPIPGEASPWIDGPGEHVASAFAEAATIGVEGCGFEMPLYAMEHALSPAFQAAPAGPNHGFLRADALLMVIILTDEDDCSSDDDEIDQRTVMDINHPFTTTQPDYGCTDEEGRDLGEPYWPVSHYVEALDELMGLRSRWAVAVIAGTEHCETDYGSAYTAHRLRRFVEEAGDNAILSDICQADLASSMADALDTLQLACDDYPLI